MSTVNNDEPRSKGKRRPLYNSADELLHLAEELQDKCDQHERRLGTMHAISISATATLGILAIMLSVGLTRSDPDSLKAATAILWLCAFSSGVYTFVWPSKTRQNLIRDRRAMLGIVDMLREIEKAIADKENLSPLERAGFRIRLSRFNIGPGTSPASTTPRP